MELCLDMRLGNERANGGNLSGKPKGKLFPRFFLPIIFMVDQSNGLEDDGRKNEQLFVLLTPFTDFSQNRKKFSTPSRSHRRKSDPEREKKGNDVHKSRMS